jgi:hypothetical protein
MILAILLMTAQAGEIVVSTREPRPAAPWTEAVSATCGRQRLEVARPLYPLGSPARITINGRPVRGDVQTLQGELGELRAAYRMSVLCGADGRTMELRWIRGLADGQGQVRYRGGSAMFAGGALLEARSEDAGADAFWYR